MLERLKWILEQLQKLQDEERIRGEGQAVFFNAKNELIDVIETYQLQVEPVATIVQEMVKKEDLNELLDSVLNKVTHEVEQSDLIVLQAIASLSGTQSTAPTAEQVQEAKAVIAAHEEAIAA